MLLSSIVDQLHQRAVVTLYAQPFWNAKRQQHNSASNRKPCTSYTRRGDCAWLHLPSNLQLLLRLASLSHLLRSRSEKAQARRRGPTCSRRHRGYHLPPDALLAVFSEAPDVTSPDQTDWSGMTSRSRCGDRVPAWLALLPGSRVSSLAGPRLLHSCHTCGVCARDTARARAHTHTHTSTPSHFFSTDSCASSWPRTSAFTFSASHAGFTDSC